MFSGLSFQKLKCGFLSACACVFVSVCSSQKWVSKHIYNILSLLATHINCRGSKDSRFTEENKSVLWLSNPATQLFNWYMNKHKIKEGWMNKICSKIKSPGNPHFIVMGNQSVITCTFFLTTEPKLITTLDKWNFFWQTVNLASFLCYRRHTWLYSSILQ